jgi:hypothetical protein
MTITLHIHESWSAAVPHALGRILAGLAALERPRAPGDDLDDLSELLAGMEQLPKANAIGKREGWPRLVSDWEPSMVADAYAELTTAESAANGRPH